MQPVCHTLRPSDVAGWEMSAHVFTLSQVIPIVHILSRKVQMLFGETMGIDTMQKSLKEAMISHPGYKATLFTEEEVEQYRQDLIRELEILNSTSEDTAASNSCDSGPA